MSLASDTAIDPPLSQGVGYGIVLGVGLLFAFGMAGVTHLLRIYLKEDNHKSEMFMVANRSVGTGLTASAVISSWLWSTAILASTYTTFLFGVSAALWFASGCSTMVVYFAVLAIQCKLKAPTAHTALEIIKIRYGSLTHCVYIFLFLINNIIAVANMLLGASATVSAMTGMHIMASTFLIPVGVTIYTLVGGLKATFLTDYVHTTIILLVLCWLTSKILANETISSIGNLYELVLNATTRSNNFVEGNSHGSWLTVTSKQGIYFGLIHVMANFGLVIMDTSFWQKGFSANVAAAAPGYILGGLCYFGIPFSVGTLAAMGALALQDTPAFPTYPRLMSSTEISDGLVLPYIAMTVAGKGGAAAIVLIVFMCVTSTVSAQLLATSSIFSYDIYYSYINKKATDRDIIRWSHFGVVFFALFFAGFSAMLYYVGVGFGWTLYMLGIITCPGIFPTSFAILWKRQSRPAAIISPLLGMASGLVIWLVTANQLYGEVTVASTGQSLPCLYGTLASCFTPAIYTLIISFIKPSVYDWSLMKNDNLLIDSENSSINSNNNNNTNDKSGSEFEQKYSTDEGIIENQYDEKDKTNNVVVDVEASSISDNSNENKNKDNYYNSEPYMRRMIKISSIFAIATFLGHWILWPLPMYASKYVFSKGFFVAWIVVGLIWLWICMLVAVFGPLIGGRNQLLLVWNGIYSTITNRKRRKDNTNL